MAVSCFCMVAPVLVGPVYPRPAKCPSAPSLRPLAGSGNCFRTRSLGGWTTTNDEDGKGSLRSVERGHQPLGGDRTVGVHHQISDLVPVGRHVQVDAEPAAMSHVG